MFRHMAVLLQVLTRGAATRSWSSLYLASVSAIVATKWQIKAPAQTPRDWKTKKNLFVCCEQNPTFLAFLPKTWLQSALCRFWRPWKLKKTSNLNASTFRLFFRTAPRFRRPDATKTQLLQYISRPLVCNSYGNFGCALYGNVIVKFSAFVARSCRSRLGETWEELVNASLHPRCRELAGAWIGITYFAKKFWAMVAGP